MKADHRHELKSNELAAWLANLPEWIRDNRSTLIASAAIIVVAVAVYFWIFYQRNIASARGQVRLTNLVTQLPGQKAGLARSMGQQNDQSYLLINLAQDLQDFGQSTHNKQMSALALIERGETLRTELHYRSGPVGRDDLAKQIALAQASYNQALEKASTNPALAAKANVTLVLEPLNSLVDHHGYFLDNPDAAADVVRAVGHPNVGLLYDCYHMQIMSGNVIETIRTNIDVIRHFHSAGVPGRHELDSGEMYYPGIVDAIAATGYKGCFGLEYFPAEDSAVSLGRMRKLLPDR